MEILKLSDIMAIVKHSPKFHKEVEGGETDPVFGLGRGRTMTGEEVITIVKDRLEEIRPRFGVQSISLFGSVVRGEARQDSDILWDVVQTKIAPLLAVRSSYLRQSPQ
jgi:hypothetical protein